MKSEDSSRLRIDVRQTEGVVILDLTGELTLGPGHWRLWEKASALAAAGVKNVILNFRRCFQNRRSGRRRIDDATDSRPRRRHKRGASEPLGVGH